MMNKMPLRLRLTALTMVILTLSCLFLTIIINFSAFKMAESIVETTPATLIDFTQSMPAVELSPTQVYIDVAPMIEIQLAKKGFRIESFIAMIIFIIFGGFLTYHISGKALEPLDELNRQMKNRTIDNLADELPLPETKDEISDLTDSFNQMIVKLNDSFLTQKRFSQNAAHELRTPLSVLKTKIDVFKKKQTHSEEEYNSLLEVLSNHTQRLYDLVKNLLDMSNLEDLTFDQNFDVYHLAENVIEDLSIVAMNKNIQLSLTGEHFNILGNHGLMYRAFYNLVENGCRYNESGGFVQIHIESNHNLVKIMFTDNGVGIPDDKKADIFEPFYRVDKSRSRTLGGTGLGLAMVNEIVKYHHGHIEVENYLPHGTIFTLILPLI